MTARAFVDTNILLYASSSDPAEAAKTALAVKVMERHDLGLSVQVLQEFYVNATRKGKSPLTPATAETIVERLLVYPVVSMTPALMGEAFAIVRRYGLSYWDAAIVAAAQALKAATLFSEDLQHGQRFGDLRVVNPFK